MKTDNWLRIGLLVLVFSLGALTTALICAWHTVPQIVDHCMEEMDDVYCQGMRRGLSLTGIDSIHVDWLMDDFETRVDSIRNER